MKLAYLIRHGKTAANEERIYCGFTDLPLSETGRAELLAARPVGGYPDTAGLRIYTSGMKRTDETLKLLFGSVPHTVVPALREMDFGAFEMRAYSELIHDPDYLAWISGDNPHHRCPDGECGADLEERVTAAFGLLSGMEGDFLCVTHGGPIAALMSLLFPDEGKNRYEWQPDEGEGYRIYLRGGVPVSFDRIPKR